MNRIRYAFALGLILSAASARAITIEADVSGPLLTRERVVALVGERLGGAVAALPGLDAGGRYRLQVWVTSQYSQPSAYLYLVEVVLQRRVTDRESGRVYWAGTHRGASWGEVPSETELARAIGELVSTRVNSWPAD